MQRAGERADVRFIVFPAAVHAGEQRRLRNIRQQEVRGECKRLHFLHIQGVKARVQPAVIGHRGINDARPAGYQQRVHNVPDMGDLPAAAEVAGIHRIKAKMRALPVLRNGGYVRRQVAERIARKAAGMRGEHRRGKHRRFHAACREHRQCHRERALAHAGDVLHR